MKINPYLDINHNRSNLLIRPYRDGIANFKITFESPSTNILLADRVKHFVAGIALFLPVINIIAYMALHLLFTKEIKGPDCQLKPEHMGFNPQTPDDRKTRVRFNDEVRGREYDPKKPAEDIEKLSFTKHVRRHSSY